MSSPTDAEPDPAARARSASGARATRASPSPRPEALRVGRGPRGRRPLGRRHRLGPGLQEHQDEHVLRPPQRGAAVRPAGADRRRLRADPAGPRDPPPGRPGRPPPALPPGAAQAAALRRPGRTAGGQEAARARRSWATSSTTTTRSSPRPSSRRPRRSWSRPGSPGRWATTRSSGPTGVPPPDPTAAVAAPTEPAGRPAPIARAAAAPAAPADDRPTCGSTCGSGTPTRARRSGSARRSRSPRPASSGSCRPSASSSGSRSRPRPDPAGTDRRRRLPPGRPAGLGVASPGHDASGLDDDRDETGADGGPDARGGVGQRLATASGPDAITGRAVGDGDVPRPLRHEPARLHRPLGPLGRPARRSATTSTSSNDQAGWLSTWFLISYSLVSPFMGYAGDRMRRTWLLGLGVGVWSLATVGSGLAASYGQLSVARAFLGIGEATYGVIAPTILMDLYPARRGRGCCRRSTWRCRSAARSGWRLGAGSASITAGTRRSSSSGRPGCSPRVAAFLLPEPVRGASEGVDAERLKAHERAGASREDYIDLMVNSSYTYSVLGMAFYTFAIGGLASWLPTFLTVTQGIEPGPGDRRCSGLTTLVRGGRRHERRRLAGRPAGEDEPAGPVPRARAWRCSRRSRSSWWRSTARREPWIYARDLPGRGADVHQHRPVQRGDRQRGDAEHAVGGLRGGDLRRPLPGRHLVADADGLGGRHLRPARRDGRRSSAGRSPPSAPCRRRGPGYSPENLTAGHARRRPGRVARRGRPAGRGPAPAPRDGPDARQAQGQAAGTPTRPSLAD